ncbi:MAG: hypothetical protein NTV54_15815 [Ignavibacteriales bacterium]|nr:hypothetical protein [Ignavibacteriales bacterium]
MTIVDGIPIWGEPIDAAALAQIQNCAMSAGYAAMMADHHKGYAVPTKTALVLQESGTILLAGTKLCG